MCVCLCVCVCVCVCVCRTSSPGQVLLPIANWKPKDPPVVGDDIGPQIVHVYEVTVTSMATLPGSTHLAALTRGGTHQ